MRYKCSIYFKHTVYDGCKGSYCETAYEYVQKFDLETNASYPYNSYTYKVPPTLHLWYCFWLSGSGHHTSRHTIWMLFWIEVAASVVPSWLAVQNLVLSSFGWALPQNVERVQVVPASRRVDWRGSSYNSPVLKGLEHGLKSSQKSHLSISWLGVFFAVGRSSFLQR